ncbi:MAG: hypothetical protein ACI89X_000760 [Planctomycetota bacterium]|jgi:hypothetical protein
MMHLTRKASLLAFLLPTIAAAQDQASTIARLCQKADVIVRATVQSSAHPTAQLHQLTLQPNQVLKGQIGVSFTLTEPAGKCCGRSLFALTVGDTRILFLKRLGPTVHTLGGGRGVLAVTPDILSHVQALLAAPTTNATGHLLAASVNHVEPRIADDAALALATLPNLSLTPLERSAIVSSLLQSVQRGWTRTAALADVAVRLGDANMVDSVMPVYLEAVREDQALLLRNALKRCPTQLVAERMPAFVGNSRRSNLRAAALLTELPPATALAAMTNLLQRPNHPQVQMHLCEGLLAAGVTSASLSPMVPSAVLQLAIARQNRRPTFRNIQPLR